MKVLEILDRAKAVYGMLPDRTVSPPTARSYRLEFERMLRERDLNPMRQGIARATYIFRRAAMYWAGREALARIAGECYAAGARNDLPAVQRLANELLRLMSRLETALERDPPLRAGTLPFSSPASRWHEHSEEAPRSGKNSKKDVLGLLPRHWDRGLWRAATERWTAASDQPNLDALAVALTAPVRSEEFMPGMRALGPSDGVLLQLKSPRRLDIEIAPAKSHNGKYGTLVTLLKIDPVEEPARYLAARCRAAGGRLTVSLRSKDAYRKKLMRLGVDTLQDCGVTITPNVCRNQVLADLKATLGAGLEVAAAAGHCTDRTQAKYGRVEHGRKRRGWIGGEYLRKPRLGNVARAHRLAAKRRRLGGSNDTERDPEI